MKTIFKTISAFALSASLIFSACKKDKDPEDPQPVNPQEQITSVIIKGHDISDPSAIFSASWEDTDGAGGNAPVIQALTLDSGKTYYADIILVDKTKTPFDTISHEVKEEADVHQFFYTVSATLKNNVTVERLDKDNNGLPVGLKLNLHTHSASTLLLPANGTLRIVLSHYDGIAKTAAPSPESDLDIAFPFILK